MAHAALAPDAADLTSHTITVLLVDDQAMVGEAVRRMLEGEKDIDFHFCQDPAKAIPFAQEVGPTVILQDLVMPGIDGLTLVKFLRANPATSEVPLIVLSTREEATTKAEAFALGANDYLVKLPDKIELIARIRYHSTAYINLLQRNEAFAALKASQEALAEELARASEYVVSLLPAPIESGPVTTRWKFVPSAQLGGDSLGYHWIDDDRFALYLLDVCDHGVGPALLSVQALNALRSESLPGADFTDPSSVLSALNDTFQMDQHNDLYFTIWYGVFDRRTRTLAYASGGHPPSLLVQSGAEPAELLTKNLMIGGMPDTPFAAKNVKVAPGATLYLYSDGVYEVSLAEGGMWTFEAFKDYVVSHADDAAAELPALYEHLQAIHGQEVLEDDFSMLKVRFD